MAGTFKFELVSPERVLLSVDAQEVVVPGVEGDMTVYAGHAPLITTLKPGFLDVSAEGGKRRIFVKSGFAEVTAEAVTVLAETAYESTELDGDRLASEIEIATAELESAADDDARFLANTALDRLKGFGGKAA